MKKIVSSIILKTIVLFLIVTFLSCSNDKVSYTCQKGVIRILNKDKQPCSRGGGYCVYMFYLYDSKEAYWCHTDSKTFDLYNIGDTLPTLVIVKTINNEHR